MKSRLSGVHAFLAARFSSAHPFGRHLTVGIVLLVAALASFCTIASAVRSQGPVTVFDVWLANWFNTYARAHWHTVMLIITHWHSTLGVGLMALLFAGYLYWQKAWYWLLSVVLAVSGGMILNVLLKYTFQRARPTVDAPFLMLASYSFPSGHAVNATVFYGVLAAYLMLVVLRTWPLRTLCLACACTMVGLVALSRVYLGVHFLSDVLAGIAEGCAWLSVSITTSAVLRRHRAAAGPSKGV